MISNFFGYILNWLYNIVGQNYGVAIVLFTLLIRIVLLPITIKQQKSMKKSTELQGKMKEIQFKYKNNQDQMQKEIMNLYKSENVSPFSGCLSAILQLVIILSVFWLISKPLTYMTKVQGEYSKNKQNYIVNNEGNEVEDDEVAKLYNKFNRKTIEDKNGNYYEIKIIHLAEQEYQEVNNKLQNNEVENREELENEKTALEKLKINMNFIGLDLSKVPGQNMNDFTVYIIPALYIISSFISMRLMTRKNKPNRKAIGDGTNNGNAEPDMTEQMTKSMSMITPIMAVSIAFVAPLGLALYWFVSNVLMIIERIVITKYVDSKEDKKNV